nr:uncharacterized protein LOC107449282 [Parasteatoda tepidariorum]
MKQLQKLQAESFGQSRLRGSRYSTGFRGSPKQAICPFCYKIFYDKSTMNRHVSKRVCLGLQFQVSFSDQLPNVPVSSVMPVCSSSLYRNTASPDIIDMEASEVNADVSLNESDVLCSSKVEETFNKSGKVPCPYCKKYFKGDRGVKKHLHFYGCPMAVDSKFANEH